MPGHTQVHRRLLAGAPEQARCFSNLRKDLELVLLSDSGEVLSLQQYACLTVRPDFAYRQRCCHRMLGSAGAAVVAAAAGPDAVTAADAACAVRPDHAGPVVLAKSSAAAAKLQHPKNSGQKDRRNTMHTCLFIFPCLYTYSSAGQSMHMCNRNRKHPHNPQRAISNHRLVKPYAPGRQQPCKVELLTRQH